MFRLTPKTKARMKSEKDGGPIPKRSKAQLKRRLAELRAIQNEARLKHIEKLLDGAGVPKWTEHAAGVPSNSPENRLAWFILRRKDVKPSERVSEDRLARDMDELEATALHYMRKKGQPA